MSKKATAKKLNEFTSYEWETNLLLRHHKQENVYNNKILPYSYQQYITHEHGRLVLLTQF